jgi:hypothetical protein
LVEVTVKGFAHIAERGVRVARGKVPAQQGLMETHYDLGPSRQAGWKIQMLDISCS